MFMLAVLALIIILLMLIITGIVSLMVGILLGNAFYDKGTNGNSRNSVHSTVSSRTNSRV
jgi:hypothetical protein